MVVEANRSRSDLVNLKVAAVEDERATQGVSPIDHFVVGSSKVRDGVAYGQIFAPDFVYTNSGFAAVNHLVENPVAHVQHCGLVPVTVTEVTCPANQAVLPSTFRN